ncbi:uncharacterized protein ACA1_251340 [Acanthamoeba castellanii str. Neff]|uniref:Uncharacterized protein n=1 Tax=Acanthamoeba castellanii (strain ATCC 30010 / Neff) TaxID=1257118 RepID=L8HC01_ACACF|nr:uncharacterized protein ACA1_251340 [Acanthamoeba castellanii str. Neff]ELR22263.1 hypothetical protein ACA1_251340 [Acanthamoeba castellanii str. Neff]
MVDVWDRKAESDGQKATTTHNSSSPATTANNNEKTHSLTKAQLAAAAPSQLLHATADDKAPSYVHTAGIVLSQLLLWHRALLHFQPSSGALPILLSSPASSSGGHALFVREEAEELADLLWQIGCGLFFVWSGWKAAHAFSSLAPTTALRLDARNPKQRSWVDLLWKLVFKPLRRRVTLFLPAYMLTVSLVHLVNTVPATRFVLMSRGRALQLFPHSCLFASPPLLPLFAHHVGCTLSSLLCHHPSSGFWLDSRQPPYSSLCLSWPRPGTWPNACCSSTARSSCAWLCARRSGRPAPSPSPCCWPRCSSTAAAWLSSRQTMQDSSSRTPVSWHSSARWWRDTTQRSWPTRPCTCWASSGSTTLTLPQWATRRRPSPRASPNGSSSCLAPSPSWSPRLCCRRHLKRATHSSDSAATTSFCSWRCSSSTAATNLSKASPRGSSATAASWCSSFIPCAPAWWRWRSRPRRRRCRFW